MKPEELTIEALENAYGHPSQYWHGKCSELAHVATQVLGHGHYVYGHYLGPVDPEGYWTPRAFQRHGWVLLDDGRVLDPTRWSFENENPYIYIGSNNEDYDEGGNKVRGAMRSPCPKSADGNLLNLDIPMQDAALFVHLTGEAFEDLTREQAAWIANLPYDELDFSVGPIYDTLIANNLGAFIPFDNRARAKREGRISDE